MIEPLQECPSSAATTYTTDEGKRAKHYGEGWPSILRKAFSFPVFLGALLVSGVFLAVSLNLQGVTSLPAGSSHTSIFEGDTWFHILVGEDLLTTRTWPSKDSYSFTARGNDSMAYEWLGDMVLALTARLAGLRGLTALLLGLAATLMLLLYYYSYLRSGNAKAAFVACALLLPLTAVCFSLRPQLLGYIFLVIELICLERFRQGRPRSLPLPQGRSKALWVLPGLFLLWVNTHPTFVFGLMALGVYWASGLTGFCVGGLRAERWTAEQRRHLAVVSLLCVIALTLTPYGTRLGAAPLDVLLHSPLGIGHIVEYQPLGAFVGSLKLFMGLLLLFLLGQVLFRPAYRLEEIGLLVVAVYLATIHARFLLFFVLVFTPLLAALLARWVPKYEAAKDRYALNAALIILIGAGLVRFFPSSQDLEQVVARGFPREAVQYLRQHPVAGPMFNEDLWGAYLIRSLGREHKVFIDGRSQLYEESGVFADYLNIVQVDRETQFLLRKYGVKACLLERGAPLATLLAALPDWEKVYEDELSVLFLCKTKKQDSAPRI